MAFLRFCPKRNAALRVTEPMTTIGCVIVRRGRRSFISVAAPQRQIAERPVSTELVKVVSPEGDDDVLHAATINAAYELHVDDVTGSLEVGKSADLIVLDRNLLKIRAEEFAKPRRSKRWSCTPGLDRHHLSAAHLGRGARIGTLSEGRSGPGSSPSSNLLRSPVQTFHFRRPMRRPLPPRATRNSTRRLGQPEWPST
jgi:hypothetical protein